MKTYEAYQRGNEVEVVKVGWSWPALFFTWIWALVKKQWGVAIIAFAAVWILPFFMGAVGSLVPVIVSILMAWYGNDKIVASSLKKHGFSLMTNSPYQAKNKNNAMQIAIANSVSQASSEKSSAPASAA